MDWIPKVGDTVQQRHGGWLFSWTQKCAACTHTTSHETRAFYDDKSDAQAEGTVCAGCGYVSKVSYLKGEPS